MTRKIAYPRTRLSTRQRFSKPHARPLLWMLPNEIMMSILKRMHVKDLLNVCCTHPHLRDLVNSHVSVWSSVGFSDVWPTQPNIIHFQRAADQGNLEAVIKLGIAYLYNEGLPGDFEGKRITANGERAAQMFCRVECLTPKTTPFTWLFMRPPWAIAGACCKECVFTNMKAIALESKESSATFCVSKTLELLGTDESHKEMLTFLKRGAVLGDANAKHLFWQYTYKNKVLDRATELEYLRELRDVASMGHLESQVALCQAYASGRYGGYSCDQAATYVREFLKLSHPTNVQNMYRDKKLTQSMRYILIDWLVEVAAMKDFCTRTLDMAISVVDRFLRCHQTTRSRLQLLGVSAMVLCSRLLGKEIITIREAAWLTDNTYKYEDVVRMMGEITATLSGKFRVITALDYLEILSELAENDTTTQQLTEYICQTAVLHSEFGVYPQAKLSAGCVLLARIFRHKESLWTAKMEQFSGFQQNEVATCMLHIYQKCFQDGPVTDHRDVVLEAVKHRYAEDKFCRVSQIEIPSYEHICAVIDIPDDAEKLLGDGLKDTSLQIPLNSSLKRIEKSDAVSEKALETSERSSDQMSQEREKAATPTVEPSALKSSLLALDESMLSGYDGDKEDEGESLDMDGYDSDPDLDSLWCADNLNKSGDHASCEENQSSDDTLFLNDSYTSLTPQSVRTHPFQMVSPPSGPVPYTPQSSVTTTPTTSQCASCVVPASSPSGATSATPLLASLLSINTTSSQSSVCIYQEAESTTAQSATKPLLSVLSSQRAQNTPYNAHSPLCSIMNKPTHNHQKTNKRKNTHDIVTDIENKAQILSS